MHSEDDRSAPAPQTYSGRDILYREGAIGLLDVQRAADALLRQGRKPSVAAIREHLGGGSPNTITPLLAKYWEELGSRLGDGPESLERVPEALARVTELLWRRALEEARERLKIVQSPDQAGGKLEELQEQIGKLSLALAEGRAREGEQVAQLAAFSKTNAWLRDERRNLTVLLRGQQALLAQQASRIDMLSDRRTRKLERATSSIRRIVRNQRKRKKPKAVAQGRLRAKSRIGRGRK